MKKLFLLLAAGITVSSVVNAQQLNSVVLKGNTTKGLDQYKAKSVKPLAHGKATANKKTNTDPAAWFSFEDALTTGSSSLALWPIYNDTTLIISVADGATAPFNWYVQGMGTSFDPTSQAFGNYFVNPNPSYGIPQYVVTSTDNYTVDSISVAGLYDRKAYNASNIVDTLNIYVAYSGSSTNSTGVDAFTYNADPFWYQSIGIPDSQFHYATPAYDSITNSVTSAMVPGVVKIQKLLDAAAYADTTSAGLHQWTFPLSMAVPAGAKVVAYEQYVSGHQYGINSDLDSANIWNVLAEEMNGASTFPTQFEDDFNAGLVEFDNDRYNFGDTSGFIYQGTHFIPSTYLYSSADLTLDNPYLAFHLNCTTCNPLAVTNVKNTISAVNAYPNPAVNTVNIPFTLSQNADVTVTLTNAIGQTVAVQNMGKVASGMATFDVAKLSGGIYIYTLQANGQRFTGRTVVAH